MNTHYLKRIANFGIALTLCAFVFAGCSSPAKQIVGHWTIDTSRPEIADNNNNDPMTARLIKEFTFDFTSDGKFKLSNFVSGTYKINDHDVDLHAETINIKGVGTTTNEKDLHAFLSNDGNYLTVEILGNMVFVKTVEK